MNADIIIERVKDHNERELDQATDTFIRRIGDELNEAFSRGPVLEFVPARYLGFPVFDIEQDFSNFVIGTTSIYANEKELEKAGLKPFAKYFEKHKDAEIYGFGKLDDPIGSIQLKSLFEALEKKGFKCYISSHNEQFIVVLEIK